MDTEQRKHIIQTLETKSLTKSHIFNITHDIFQETKNVLHEMSGEINEELNARAIKLEYRDKGTFVAQLQVAGDMLIFSMHTNVFVFDPKHSIWENEYVKKDKFNAYCGVINVYNFLADSFKYNRMDDEGYLITRIFINKDKSFFVEGHNTIKYGVEEFGQHKFTEEIMIDVFETIISRTISFDLYVPPMDAVRRIIADQVNTKIENSKIETGKRMGFDF
ncbi:MAG: hypothetical protein IMY73_02970 [Bacteroidetes bacterium]|nr:hypothetical protein [Bacteroidota bacterium]